MEKGICYIMGACGPAKAYINKNKPAFVMACDGGLALLGDVKADIAVGDFDSLGYRPQGIEVLYHQPEKDDTDTMMAIKKGFELGYKTFVLYGCMGGRIDHAYANYQTLAYITAQGGRGYLAGDGWYVTHIAEDKITVSGKKGEYFSVFSPSDRSIVTIKGGKYSIENAEVRNDFPVGVSNEFLDGDAEIEVKKGSALIMWRADPEEYIDRI